MVNYNIFVKENPLKGLWDSTKELFNRFDLKVDSEKHGRKLSEEFYEFLNAERFLEFHEGLLSNVPEAESTMIDLRLDMTQEFVDMVVVGMVLLQRHGVIYNNLESAFEYVIDKNDAKDGYTHEVKDGLIVRK